MVGSQKYPDVDIIVGTVPIQLLQSKRDRTRVEFIGGPDNARRIHIGHDSNVDTDVPDFILPNEKFVENKPDIWLQEFWAVSSGAALTLRVREWFG